MFSILEFINENNCHSFKPLSFCNKREIRCGVNHATLPHWEYRKQILTVISGPRHNVEYSNYFFG